MEYSFELPLDRPTSQQVFGEEQVSITVTVTGAEQIAALTEGNVYVAGESLDYQGYAYYRVKEAIDTAIRALAAQKATTQTVKQVDVDINEVKDKAVAACEVVKAAEAEKVRREAEERAFHAELEAHMKALAIPGVTYGVSSWGDTCKVVIHAGGDEIAMTRQEFLAATTADIYGLVIASLQQRLTKAEEKLATAREEVLADIVQEGNFTLDEQREVTYRVEAEDC